MRGTESIHDIDVGKCCQLSRERFVVLLFTRVDSNVLEEGDVFVTRFITIEIVFDETDLKAREGFDTFCNRRQASVGLGGNRLAFFRSAQVRHDHHFGARRNGVLQRWQGRSNAGIAGHSAGINRNVEILTDQDALASDVQARQLNDIHAFIPITAATTFSTVKPKCSKRSPPGALAPKLAMPMTSPSRPTHLRQ